MAMYSKKEANVQFYILFFAFLAITLFFILPQFKDNLNGKEWIGIDVTPKVKNSINIADSLLSKNKTATAKLVSQSNLFVKVQPNTGWGWYVFFQDIFSFFMFFIGLWYVLKFLKALQSEDRFESKTAFYILRVGQLVVLGGILAYANKYFINYF